MRIHDNLSYNTISLCNNTIHLVQVIMYYNSFIVLIDQFISEFIPLLFFSLIYCFLFTIFLVKNLKHGRSLPVDAILFANSLPGTQIIKCLPSYPSSVGLTCLFSLEI